jgi:excisionase family DNA binding protein
MIRVPQGTRTRKSRMNATVAEVDQIMSLPTCTVDEAAKVLRIGRTQAYMAVRTGEIRSIHIGKRVLVPTSAIRQLLDGGTSSAA